MYPYRFIKKIEKAINHKVGSFNIEAAVTKEPVCFEKRLSLDYKTFRPGEKWGELFDCGWFKLTGEIDPNMVEKVYLHLDINGEALLFDEAGVPLKGFTNGSSTFGFMGHLGSPMKRYYPLKEFIKENGSITLWLDAGMNDLFGNVKKKGRIEFVDVVTRDLAMRKLYYDLKVLAELKIASIKRDKQAYRKYFKGIKHIRRIAFKDSNWVAKALSITGDILATRTKSTHQISSIGHAHLDLAWLWPIRETHRKSARTFANALRLMDQYEDFKFGASQPQLYQWIKEQHPKIYDQIKEKVKIGQWEVQGGMWVEADTNVSGEEALVRQMLYGVRFFKEEFDVRVKSLWLPDVFGYSGNMPQIIKKSGLDYFMTIKISWNDTNKFPHHTFIWKGIDGSEVLSHMPPEGEYNSPANSYFLLKSAEKYLEKHIDQQTLNLFGVGDGGGGPAPAHVERLQRFNGVAPMPKIIIEKSSDFFERLGKIKEKFPTYKGELYLEKHRGTYTSQGQVKYYNRKMEQKLKTLETLLIQVNRSDVYKQELEAIWKEILLYQFHDILPGSSIKRVYDECIHRYEQLSRRLDEIIGESLGSKPVDDKTEIDIETLNMYNPLLTEVTCSRNTASTYQLLTTAPMSNKVINRQSFIKEVGRDTNSLENSQIKVNFYKDGSIKKIYDKMRKQQVLSGVGNQLRVYKDLANAWDIFRYYRWLPSSKMKLAKAEAYTYGPIQQLVQHYVYGRSTVVQTITLRPDSKRIEFSLDVQWSSLKRMLRTAFPLNLQTDEAIFDIQFGHIKRSTKNNTKILKAQYEVSGHNWVDMNDGTWGAALITDSKYGFRAKNSTLDLNLIRSTNYPAKDGDIGHHQIKYGLLIHDGDFRQGQVDEEAMSFNTHMPITRSNLVINQQIIQLSSDQVTYSSIKSSEEDDHIIVRLYERYGSDAVVKVIADSSITGIYETNMIEEEALLLTKGRVIELNFTPFEVKTLKLIQ